ncbi:hypothetical protein CYMTET_31544 [Cymbomonas tetramitiformis]|uniref:Protein YIP n=1 Tax=Cymbomonas tetramitiformis TaxID=36881 RepID=A0AAE0KT51_9CHLO|nr:hypothetical protein CYMTET_31544 [Cymbomonas tetramitiformis]
MSTAANNGSEKDELVIRDESSVLSAQAGGLTSAFKEQWMVISHPFTNNKGLLNSLSNRGILVPVLLSLVFSGLLASGVTQPSERVNTFLLVTLSVWIGEALVIASAIFIGASVASIQGVRLLSYGLLPLIFAVCLCVNVTGPWLRALLVTPCFMWSSYATVPAIATASPSTRRSLVTYPIFFYYMCLSWMILVATSSI